MLGQLRATLKPLVRAAARPIAASGITPNTLSTLALPASLLAALAIVNSWFFLAFLLTLGAMAVDFLDGTVAELQNRRTPFGNYFETMIDRIVEIILYLALARHCPLAAMTALSFSLLVSYAKARVALVIITDNRDWPALGDRADRVCLLLLGLLIPRLLWLVLWLIAGMTLVGSIQRMIYAHDLILEAEQNGTLLSDLAKRKEQSSPSGTNA